MGPTWPPMSSATCRMMTGQTSRQRLETGRNGHCANVKASIQSKTKDLFVLMCSFSIKIFLFTDPWSPMTAIRCLASL